MIGRSRGARAALLLAATALASCGGSSGPVPGTCTRDTLSATGPGDTLAYFPVDVGRTWSYGTSTGEVIDARVARTQAVGTEVGYVFTSSSSITGPAGDEVVVKRPHGAYIISDAGAEPPLDQLYPSLLLPFPVAVTAPLEIARCTALDVGDLDGDGKADHADLVGTLRVLSVTETAQVGAGSFTDVAHAQLAVQLTVTGTRAGKVTVSATEDDWYARGVGRVVARRAMTAGTQSQTATMSLNAYTTPASALVAGTSPPSALPAEAPMASPALAAGAPLEEYARRLVLRLLRAGR